MGQYAQGLALQSMPSACIDDITAPTFAGIDALSVDVFGGLVASWLAASDVSAPIRYNVYVKKDTATGLFSETPFCTEGLTYTIYTLPDGTNLEYNQTYYVGVRAVDAVGNIETNTASLSEVSTGVLAGAIRYECFASIAITPDNNLIGSLFLHGDGKAIKSNLGTASFKIFDSDENEVVSFTQSGLTANGDGVYSLAPVSAAPLDPFTFYRMQVVINHNAVNVESYIGVQIGE